MLAFGWFLADGHLGFGPEVLRGGPQALAGMPANVRAAIVPDLTHAFSVAFCIAAAISLAGFISICFLEEVPLKTIADKAPVASGGVRGQSAK